MVSEILIGRIIYLHTLHYGVDLKMLAHSDSISLPVIMFILMPTYRFYHASCCSLLGLWKAFGIVDSV